MYRLGAVLSIVLLAGCAGDLPDPLDRDAVAPLLPEPIHQTVDLAGCQASIVIFLTDFHTVERVLPAGFHPSDAAELLDVPAAAGRAGVVASINECTDSTAQDDPVRYFDTSVLVQEPHVASVDTNASYHAYLLERKVTDGAFADGMRELGVPTSHARSISLAAPVLDAATMGADVADDGGPGHFHLDAVISGQTTFPGNLVRFWHVDADGTTYLDQNLTLEAVVGEGTCDYHRTAAVAAVFGADGCLHTTAVYLQFPAFDLPTRFVRLPEVYPA